MLLGGDEIGRTQRGNNNAYCQDNEISWFDWTLDDRRRSAARLHAAPDRAAPAAPGAAAPALLRGRLHLGVGLQGPGLAAPRRRGDDARTTGRCPGSRRWRSCWAATRCRRSTSAGARLIDDGLLVLLNAHHEPITFKLPAEEGAGAWLVQLDTAEPDKAADAPAAARVQGRGAVAGDVAPAARREDAARGGDARRCAWRRSRPSGGAGAPAS